MLDLIEGHYCKPDLCFGAFKMFFYLFLWFKRFRKWTLNSKEYVSAGNTSKFNG
jgi:hypothetical protein